MQIQVFCSGLIRSFNCAFHCVLYVHIITRIQLLEGNSRPSRTVYPSFSPPSLPPFLPPLYSEGIRIRSDPETAHKYQHPHAL